MPEIPWQGSCADSAISWIACSTPVELGLAQGMFVINNSPGTTISGIAISEGLRDSDGDGDGPNGDPVGDQGDTDPDEIDDGIDPTGDQDDTNPGEIDGDDGGGITFIGIGGVGDPPGGVQSAIR